MRRGLILVLVGGAIALGVVDVAGGVSCPLSSCSSSQPLVATFGGTVSPRTLPRNEYAPVTANIFGRISTRDGTHPPALREAVVDIDRDVRINAKGYPTCRMRELTGRSTRASLRVCGDSLLGEGIAKFGISFPEQDGKVHPDLLLASLDNLLPPPRLLVFNGGEKGGKVTLLIHTFITVPAPTAIVATVTLSRNGSGLHAVATIPAVAEGQGSLLDFGFKFGKTYEYKGEQVGYLEAKCPEGVFKVDFPRLLFENEAQVPGVPATTTLAGKLAVPCTPSS
jgi:hypothetical protein